MENRTQTLKLGSLWSAKHAVFSYEEDQSPAGKRSLYNILMLLVDLVTVPYTRRMTQFLDRGIFGSIVKAGALSHIFVTLSSVCVLCLPLFSRRAVIDSFFLSVGVFLCR